MNNEVQHTESGNSPPETIAGYKIHADAFHFPLMDKFELEGLVENIKTHGQQEPIVGLEETREILDGRNRLIACERAGREPVIVWKPTPPDTVAFVFSANLHRRHLPAEQRAAIYLRAQEQSGDEIRKEACERMLAGTLASRDARVGKTAAIVAKIAEVSPRTVERVLAASKDNPEALDEIAKGKTTSAKVRAATAKPKAKKTQAELDDDEKVALLGSASAALEEYVIPSLKNHGGFPHLVKQAQALYKAIEAAIVGDLEPEPPKPKGKRKAKAEPRVMVTDIIAPIVECNGQPPVGLHECLPFTQSQYGLSVSCRCGWHLRTVVNTEEDARACHERHVRKVLRRLGIEPTPAVEAVS